ncbi:MAG: c-type cytochrome, partial [Myxococcales bacterium]|nr:c-type cytochrome [Myxococcales bacterium]
MTAPAERSPSLRWFWVAPLAVLAPAVLVAATLRWAAGPARGVAGRGLGATQGPERGEVIFRQRCGICHPVGERSAQGPGLGGVLGRKAASAPGFGYSRALRSSGLTWDRPTLDRFLASPPALVPGTVMPMALPVEGERRDVIAYLTTLRGDPAAASDAVPTVAPSPGDYHGDAPGVRHRVTVAGLPVPFATPSAQNGPSTAPRPEGAKPVAPAGFSVALFARDLQNPRLLRVAPGGDVFVAESAIGQLRVLRTRDGASAP